jgi:hypothetical protein
MLRTKSSSKPCFGKIQYSSKNTLNGFSSFLTGNSQKRFFTKAANPFYEVLQKGLKDIEAAGTYKRERIIVSPQSATIEVNNPKTGKRDSVLNFW